MMKNILASLLNSAVLLAVLGSGLMLFYFNQQARSLEKELDQLNKAIKSETVALRILKAEWAHLSRPERIIKHAQNLLPELVPTTAGQIYNFHLHDNQTGDSGSNGDEIAGQDISKNLSSWQPGNRPISYSSLLQQYFNLSGQ